MKKIIIILSLIVVFTLSSCGVLVPNTATIEIAVGNNTPTTGTDTSSDLEMKDITFVGYTEDKKFSLKEDKSNKITLNWFGDGQKTFDVTYQYVATFTTGDPFKTYVKTTITLTNFENIKYYLTNKPADKPQIEKLK